MGLTKPWHWAVLIVIVLLLFGAKRLPDLAKSVGQSLKIFKKEIKELQEDDAPVAKAAPVAPVAPVPPVIPVAPVTPVVTPPAAAQPGDPAPSMSSESTAPPKV